MDRPQLLQGRRVAWSPRKCMAGGRPRLRRCLCLCLVVAQLLDERTLLALHLLQRLVLPLQPVQCRPLLRNQRADLLLPPLARLGLRLREVARADGAQLLLLDGRGRRRQHLDERVHRRIKRLDLLHEGAARLLQRPRLVELVRLQHAHAVLVVERDRHIRVHRDARAHWRPHRPPWRRYKHPQRLTRHQTKPTHASVTLPRRAQLHGAARLPQSR
mmetsp:Transcript_8873/g.31372  ORF Transcript_8873/g.31372 Transcript_8873/m.31372 type:complete len:216 (-) Transcript_8873:16-663(-)